MHRFAEEVAALVEGFDYAAFVADLQKRRAVERCIEIVGEAANRISAEFRAEHPEIAWCPIIAQRHILAHEYSDIRVDAIWRVATIRIGELLRVLTPLLRDPDQPPPI
jgi:uncharacterized protein with HEPN domain